MHFFPKFSTGFVDWTTEKGRQGNNVLPSRLFWRVYCTFLSENVSNWHRKWQKTQNFPFFNYFCFFLKVSTNFVDWNVLKCQRGNDWFSSSLWGRDNCNIRNENVSNWHRKWQKSDFFSIFNDFIIFPEFSTDFVDWNVEKCQHGKNVLSSRFFRKVYCSFLSGNVSNWLREWKKSKTFQFSKISFHFY